MKSRKRKGTDFIAAWRRTRIPCHFWCRNGRGLPIPVDCMRGGQQPGVRWPDSRFRWGQRGVWSHTWLRIAPWTAAGVASDRPVEARRPGCTAQPPRCRGQALREAPCCGGRKCGLNSVVRREARRCGGLNLLSGSSPQRRPGCCPTLIQSTKREHLAREKSSEIQETQGPGQGMQTPPGAPRHAPASGGALRACSKVIVKSLIADEDPGILAQGSWDPCQGSQDPWPRIPGSLPGILGSLGEDPRILVPGSRDPGTSGGAPHSALQRGPMLARAGPASLGIPSNSVGFIFFRCPFLAESNCSRPKTGTWREENRVKSRKHKAHGAGRDLLSGPELHAVRPESVVPAKLLSAERRAKILNRDVMVCLWNHTVPSSLPHVAKLPTPFSQKQVRPQRSPA